MSHSRRPSHPHAGAKRESALSDSRTTRVIERVRAIPEGYVRTYGDIDAGAPRLVGRILASTHDLPWHRVVRADGSIPQGQRNESCYSRKASHSAETESTSIRRASPPEF